MDLYNHPQWKKDVLIYQNDIKKFAVDAFGFIPTWQQALFFENIQVNGNRVSVKYGWGCDEAMMDAFAITILHNLLFKIDSCTLILTPQKDIKHLVLRECIAGFIKKISQNALVYLAKYIVGKAKSFCIKGREYFANVTIKREQSRNEPHSIAGTFSENYLLIVIDAARINQSWLEVGCGSLVHHDNRCIFSQKMDTDISSEGFFYHTQHSEKWKSLTFSAAENPLYEWDEHGKLAIASDLKPCIVDGNFFKKSN
ncbi:hypothetical protein [Acinetobacter sp. Ac_5812]|uniref:hypothetical protein n=1 Tax=Acinetobacter sp. Ac_5812 TaxID=1848937 RepID=UPI00148FA2B7|nr:hypothetical protein [Acinetobacter sp. Ac_5812]NNP70398.1 hypothetical protein [Acinetobacter sp. Ac_5812]